MSFPGPRFTYEDYKLMPEDKRYEVIEGDLLMTPAPNVPHQKTLGRLYRKLAAFVEEEGLGDVLLAPTDVILSSENVIQPDLLFVSQERLSVIDRDGVHAAPDLVVEILSPSTAVRDQVVKRKLYAKYGVREYWVVNPESRSVEVAVLGAGGLETWRTFPVSSTLASPLLAGLAIQVSELFAQ